MEDSKPKEETSPSPPPTTEHRNRVFQDETVALDFHEFMECNFEGCELVFHGEGPFSFTNCEFDECNWQFAGSAAVTLHFLSQMHDHGGVLQDIVEDLVDDICGGDEQ